MQKYLPKASGGVNPSHSLNLVTCRCLLHLGTVSTCWGYFGKFRTKREYVSSPQGILCALFQQRNGRFKKKKSFSYLQRPAFTPLSDLGRNGRKLAVSPLFLSQILYVFMLEVNYRSLRKNRGEESILCPLLWTALLQIVTPRLEYGTKKTPYCIAPTNYTVCRYSWVFSVKLYQTGPALITGLLHPSKFDNKCFFKEFKSKNYSSRFPIPKIFPIS